MPSLSASPSLGFRKAELPAFSKAGLQPTVMKRAGAVASAPGIGVMKDASHGLSVPASGLASKGLARSREELRKGAQGVLPMSGSKCGCSNGNGKCECAGLPQQSALAKRGLTISREELRRSAESVWRKRAYASNGAKSGCGCTNGAGGCECQGLPAPSALAKRGLGSLGQVPMVSAPSSNAFARLSNDGLVPPREQDQIPGMPRIAGALELGARDVFTASSRGLLALPLARGPTPELTTRLSGAFAVSTINELSRVGLSASPRLREASASLEGAAVATVRSFAKTREGQISLAHAASTAEKTTPANALRTMQMLLSGGASYGLTFQQRLLALLSWAARNARVTRTTTGASAHAGGGLRLSVAAGQPAAMGAVDPMRLSLFASETSTTIALGEVGQPVPTVLRPPPGSAVLSLAATRAATQAGGATRTQKQGGRLAAAVTGIARNVDLGARARRTSLRSLGPRVGAVDVRASSPVAIKGAIQPASRAPRAVGTANRIVSRLPRSTIQQPVARSAMLSAGVHVHVAPTIVRYSHGEGIDSYTDRLRVRDVAGRLSAVADEPTWKDRSASGVTVQGVRDGSRIWEEKVEGALFTRQPRIDPRLCEIMGPFCPEEEAAKFEQVFAPPSPERLRESQRRWAEWKQAEQQRVADRKRAYDESGRGRIIEFWLLLEIVRVARVPGTPPPEPFRSHHPPETFRWAYSTSEDVWQAALRERRRMYWLPWPPKAPDQALLDALVFVTRKSTGAEDEFVLDMARATLGRSDKEEIGRVQQRLEDGSLTPAERGQEGPECPPGKVCGEIDLWIILVAAVGVAVVGGAVLGIGCLAGWSWACGAIESIFDWFVGLFESGSEPEPAPKPPPKVEEGDEKETEKSCQEDPTQDGCEETTPTTPTTPTPRTPPTRTGGCVTNSDCGTLLVCYNGKCTLPPFLVPGYDPTVPWDYDDPIPPPDSTRDWCGSKGTEWVPDSVAGIDISGACKRHDECYGDCDGRKSLCDQNFFNQILAICGAQGGPSGACFSLAVLYYNGVRNIAGNNAWDSGQCANGCPRCGDYG